MDRRVFVLLCFTTAALIGCNSPPSGEIPSHMFSGSSNVVNQSLMEINVIEFSDYGWAMPAQGPFPPGVFKLSRFPPVDRLPIKTTVTWQENGSADLHTQELLVEELVPRGRPGTIVFCYGQDSKWTVDFAEEEDHKQAQPSR